LSNAFVKCGTAFENLRYYYEDPNKVVYYIGDFAWILMRAIVEAKTGMDAAGAPSPASLGQAAL
jgi:hypothetical protein